MNDGANMAQRYEREIPEGYEARIEGNKVIIELKETESEDERIRKGLIEALKTSKTVGELKFILPEPIREECIAYLKKQKEQKHPNGCFTCDEYKKGYEAGRSNGFTAGYNKAMKEQKPVKKEITLTNFEEVLNTFLFDFANSPIEDCEPKEYTKKHSAEILKAAYTELNAQLKQDIFEAQQEGRREGYEAAKAEQKPAEWSEEDKKILDELLDHCNTENATWYNFLKSLRHFWKPSEEQIGTLERWLLDNEFKGDSRYVYPIFESLYNDLKKLI